MSAVHDADVVNPFQGWGDQHVVPTTMGRLVPNQAALLATVAVKHARELNVGTVHALLTRGMEDTRNALQMIGLYMEWLYEDLHHQAMQGATTFENTKRRVEQFRAQFPALSVLHQMLNAPEELEEGLIARIQSSADTLGMRGGGGGFGGGPLRRSATPRERRASRRHAFMAKRRAAIIAKSKAAARAAKRAARDAAARGTLSDQLLTELREELPEVPPADLPEVAATMKATVDTTAASFAKDHRMKVQGVMDMAHIMKHDAPHIFAKPTPVHPSKRTDVVILEALRECVTKVIPMMLAGTRAAREGISRATMAHVSNMLTVVMQGWQTLVTHNTARAKQPTASSTFGRSINTLWDVLLLGTQAYNTLPVLADLLGAIHVRYEMDEDALFVKVEKSARIPIKKQVRGGGRDGLIKELTSLNTVIEYEWDKLKQAYNNNDAIVIKFNSLREKVKQAKQLATELCELDNFNGLDKSLKDIVNRWLAQKPLQKISKGRLERQARADCQKPWTKDPHAKSCMYQTHDEAQGQTNRRVQRRVRQRSPADKSVQKLDRAGQRVAAVCEKNLTSLKSLLTMAEQQRRGVTELERAKRIVAADTATKCVQQGLETLVQEALSDASISLQTTSPRDTIASVSSMFRSSVVAPAAAATTQGMANLALQGAIGVSMEVLGTFHWLRNLFGIKWGSFKVPRSIVKLQHAGIGNKSLGGMLGMAPRTMQTFANLSSRITFASDAIVTTWMEAEQGDRRKHWARRVGEGMVKALLFTGSRWVVMNYLSAQFGMSGVPLLVSSAILGACGTLTRAKAAKRLHDLYQVAQQERTRAITPLQASNRRRAILDKSAATPIPEIMLENVLAMDDPQVALHQDTWLKEVPSLVWKAHHVVIMENGQTLQQVCLPQFVKSSSPPPEVGAASFETCSTNVRKFNASATSAPRGGVQLTKKQKLQAIEVWQSVRNLIANEERMKLMLKLLWRMIGHAVNILSSFSESKACSDECAQVLQDRPTPWEHSSSVAEALELVLAPLQKGLESIPSGEVDTDLKHKPKVSAVTAVADVTSFAIACWNITVRHPTSWTPSSGLSNEFANLQDELVALQTFVEVYSPPSDAEEVSILTTASKLWTLLGTDLEVDAWAQVHQTSVIKHPDATQVRLDAWARDLNVVERFSLELHKSFVFRLGVVTKNAAGKKTVHTPLDHCVSSSMLMCWNLTLQEMVVALRKRNRDFQPWEKWQTAENRERFLKASSVLKVPTLADDARATDDVTKAVLVSLQQNLELLTVTLIDCVDVCIHLLSIFQGTSEQAGDSLLWRRIFNGIGDSQLSFRPLKIVFGTFCDVLSLLGNTITRLNSLNTLVNAGVGVWDAQKMVKFAAGVRDITLRVCTSDGAKASPAAFRIGDMLLPNTNLSHVVRMTGMSLLHMTTRLYTFVSNEHQDRRDFKVDAGVLFTHGDEAAIDAVARMPYFQHQLEGCRSCLQLWIDSHENVIPATTKEQEVFRRQLIIRINHAHDDGTYPQSGTVVMQMKFFDQVAARILKDMDSTLTVDEVRDVMHDVQRHVQHMESTSFREQAYDTVRPMVHAACQMASIFMTSMNKTTLLGNAFSMAGAIATKQLGTFDLMYLGMGGAMYSPFVATLLLGTVSASLMALKVIKTQHGDMATKTVMGLFSAGMVHAMFKSLQEPIASKVMDLVWSRGSMEYLAEVGKSIWNPIRTSALTPSIYAMLGLSAWSVTRANATAEVWANETTVQNMRMAMQRKAAGFNQRVGQRSWMTDDLAWTITSRPGIQPMSVIRERIRTNKNLSVSQRRAQEMFYQKLEKLFDDEKAKMWHHNGKPINLTRFDSMYVVGDHNVLRPTVRTALPRVTKVSWNKSWDENSTTMQQDKRGGKAAPVVDVIASM